MKQDTLLQMVTFGLAGETFAADILYIQEIIKPPQLIKVPNSPPYVEGIINLRGRVIPVVDLKQRFGLYGETETGNGMIIIADIKGLIVGLRVDNVTEVLRIDISAFEETPSIARGFDQQFIKGIVKKNDEMIIVLDIEKLFNVDETQGLMEVGAH